VHDLRGQRLTKSKERASALEDLAKIIADHPGTKAAEEAQALAIEVRRKGT